MTPEVIIVKVLDKNNSPIYEVGDNSTMKALVEYLQGGFKVVGVTTIYGNVANITATFHYYHLVR